MGKSWIFMFLALILVVVIVTGAFVIFKKKVKLQNNNRSEPSQVMIEKDKQVEIERVSLKTDDGVEIIADFTQIRGSQFAGILLHMMPADRASWAPLAARLNQAGYSTLSLDLRGHGESINSAKGKLDYRKFSDSEHQASKFDVVAASNFLKSHEFALKNQFLVGASVGANLALQFLSENQEVKAVVLLSPGLNYRGILTEPLGKEDYGDKIMLVAATDDTYSAATVKTLKTKAKTAELLLYPDGGHGTDILRNQKEAIEKVINWLKGKLI